jgi:hypothetical protein
MFVKKTEEDFREAMQHFLKYYLMWDMKSSLCRRRGELGVIGRCCCFVSTSQRAFRFDGQPYTLPCLPAPLQGTSVEPTRLLKVSRHTGACFLIGSSTKGNEPGVAE